MLVTTKTKSRSSVNNANQEVLKLATTWETLTENSCPYDYNFHLHTNCSDGKLSPESLIEQAISLGLKGLAITDHHTMNGFYRAKKWLEQKKVSPSNTSALPYLWSGIEITSKLNGTVVHILGYAFDPKATSIQKYLTGESPKGKLAEAKKVIEALHQAGGLVVLAHPFRYRRSGRELILEAYESEIDGVEAYYAYGNPKPWQASQEQTQITKKLASKYNLYTTCGTDTHGNNILVRL